jgi:hypothetical protein
LRFDDTFEKSSNSIAIHIDLRQAPRKADIAPCPKSAKSGLMRRSNQRSSITASAGGEQCLLLAWHKFLQCD